MVQWGNKGNTGLWAELLRTVDLGWSGEKKLQKAGLEPRDDTVAVCYFHGKQKFHCTASHK